MSYDRTTNFRSLIAWQKAQDLAVLVLGELAKLPGGKKVDLVGAQLARSVGSVSANIAEGYGRFSPGAYRNHLSIARGSLFETESWLDLLFRTGHLSEETNSLLVGRCSEVGRLLTALLRNATNAGSPRISDGQGDYFFSETEEFVDGN
jgi:four helix bundle protein